MLDHIRKLFRDKGLDAVWGWAMDRDSPCGKAKRFGACAEWARLKRNEQNKGSADYKTWEERREAYHRESVKFEERCDSQREADWPASMRFAELLYHHPGPHLHAASCDREKLIQVAKIGQEKYGLRIGEFPPFDPVEGVHVQGSFHYRQFSQCSTPRNFSNRGNGLAFDANDLDGGNDREYAFYLELRRRYT